MKHWGKIFIFIVIFGLFTFQIIIDGLGPPKTDQVWHEVPVHVEQIKYAELFDGKQIAFYAQTCKGEFLIYHPDPKQLELLIEKLVAEVGNKEPVILMLVFTSWYGITTTFDEPFILNARNLNEDERKQYNKQERKDPRREWQRKQEKTNELPEI